MSWGKIYETTNWGRIQSFIHIGFNKAAALTALAGTAVLTLSYAQFEEIDVVVAPSIGVSCIGL